jgi:hypothetical protein
MQLSEFITMNSMKHETDYKLQVMRMDLFDRVSPRLGASSTLVLTIVGERQPERV